MNIILIGFKNSGKTTIGRKLAQDLSYSFIDTDEKLEEKYQGFFQEKKSIREIYNLLGENKFRSLETETLFSLGDFTKSVVATGGGTILSLENRVFFKEKGIVIFLDTPLEIIKQRLQKQSSPLFSKQSIDSLYQERYEIYRTQADYHCSIPLAESNHLENSVMMIKNHLKALKYGDK